MRNYIDHEFSSSFHLAEYENLLLLGVTKSVADKLNDPSVVITEKVYTDFNQALLNKNIKTLEKYFQGDVWVDLSQKCKFKNIYTLKINVEY